LAFLEKNAKVLDKPGAKLGVWVDKGTAFLDVSTVVETEEEAVKLGREHDQLAVFNLTEGKEVRITEKRESDQLELEPHGKGG
jgi:hypothetical protein